MATIRPGEYLMTNNEIPETVSQNNLDINDFEVKASVTMPRFSKALPKEEMKGRAAMSAEEAYYHLRILPTRDNFKPKVSIACENYPEGCSTCCNKIHLLEAAPAGESAARVCSFGKQLADTVEPMVISMLEDCE